MVILNYLEYLKSQQDPAKYKTENLGSLRTLHIDEAYKNYALEAPEKVKRIYDGDLIWIPSPDPKRASVGIIYVQTLDGKAAFKASWKAKGGLTDWYHFREILRFNVDAVGAAKNMYRGENNERPLLLSFYDHDLIKYREEILKKSRHPIGVIVTGSGEIENGLDHLAFTQEGKSIIFTSDIGLSKLEAEIKKYKNVAIESIGPSPRELNMYRMLTILKSKYGVERFLALGGPTLSTDLINAGLVDNYFINTSAVLSGDVNVRSFFHFPDSKNLIDLELISIKMADKLPKEGKNTLYLHYIPKR
ncbi:dihydrofolate reductase family protein [Candidatus Woesearchaeota archaeon]|nr:dihydrofolate reductase family protein [Candidatus Woesearchaeota archaeon]